jgi:hypothetical protein
MEKAGTATRVKGTKPGIPDTWTLAGSPSDGPGPAEAPEPAQPAQPDQDAGGSPDGAAGGETADGTGQGSTAEAGDDPAPQDGGEPEAGTSTAPGPETEQPGSRDDAPADAGHEDAAPDECNDDEAAPDSSGETPAGSGEPGGEDAASADGDGDGDAGGDAPDPALVSEIIECIDQVRAAADAAELVLTASGDLKPVLAGLDEIYEQAAQARRSVKAAIGGRSAPAVRPGGLRDKVLAHLDVHPEAELTDLPRAFRTAHLG